MDLLLLHEPYGLVPLGFLLGLYMGRVSLSYYAHQSWWKMAKQGFMI